MKVSSIYIFSSSTYLCQSGFGICIYHGKYLCWRQHWLFWQFTNTWGWGRIATNKKVILKYHKHRVHGDTIQYPCNQCDYMAIKKCDLKVHINFIHFGIKYKCDQCQYAAKRKDHLKTHIDSVHMGIRLKCNQCNLTLGGKTNLREHIRLVHNNIRRYICDKCGY